MERWKAGTTVVDQGEIPEAEAFNVASKSYEYLYGIHKGHGKFASKVFVHCPPKLRQDEGTKLAVQETNQSLKRMHVDPCIVPFSWLSVGFQCLHKLKS